MKNTKKFHKAAQLSIFCVTYIHIYIHTYSLQLEEANMRLGHELITSNQEKTKLEEQLFKVEKGKASQEELLLVVQKRIQILERGHNLKQFSYPATLASHSKVPSNEVKLSVSFRF